MGARVAGEANLESRSEVPAHRVRASIRQAPGIGVRAYFDPETRKLITAVNYPGEFAHIAAIDVDTWEVEKIVEVATPALFYVTALAYDPRRRAPSSTPRTTPASGGT